MDISTRRQFACAEHGATTVVDSQRLLDGSISLVLECGCTFLWKVSER